MMTSLGNKHTQLKSTFAIIVISSMVVGDSEAAGQLDIQHHPAIHPFWGLAKYFYCFTFA